MIYITGDTHADFKRFANKAFPRQKELTKNDYVIICGDFGGIWDRVGESEHEKHVLDEFEERNFTLLFVDGNHENFERLYSYPVKEWHGGKVHEIRPHILHLMRGQVFNDVDGLSIFSFGGAASHDISGGILEPDDPDFYHKRKILERSWQPYRINHVSWWKEEMASEEEKEEGRKNLAAHNNTVDLIVTHCCPSSTLALFGHGLYEPDHMSAYLEEIRQKVNFRDWYFGHYHDNRDINSQEHMLYERIIQIN
jgi:hypothetical protein